MLYDKDQHQKPITGFKKRNWAASQVVHDFRTLKEQTIQQKLPSVNMYSQRVEVCELKPHTIHDKNVTSKS